MCSNCGMCVEPKHPAAYHPFAACLMFRACSSGNTVDANLRAVVEYGMRAQERGASLDDAMRNITTVLR